MLNWNIGFDRVIQCACNIVGEPLLHHATLFEIRNISYLIGSSNVETAYTFNYLIGPLSRAIKFIIYLFVLHIEGTVRCVKSDKIFHAFIIYVPFLSAVTKFNGILMLQ